MCAEGRTYGFMHTQQVNQLSYSPSYSRFFETPSFYVAQAGLKLAVFPSVPLQLNLFFLIDTQKHKN